MKLYYIEKKSFHKITDGAYLQYPDYGKIPMLYTSKEKALRKAKRLTEYLEANCRYEKTIELAEINALLHPCIYSVRLAERQGSFEMVIRVYEVKTL